MREICIKKLTVNHPLKGETDFHCHLITERVHCNSKITLKIYSRNYQILSTISDFLAKNEVPNLIHIDPQNIDDDKVHSIHLPSEKATGVSFSSDFYENEQHYSLIVFSEVYIEEKLSNDERKLDRCESYFHLTEQVVPLFGDEYFYSSNNIGTWKATQRQNKFRRYLNFQYKFKVLFPTKTSFHKGSHELIISRNPVLNIIYKRGELTQDFPDLMTKLISFFLRENIDYHFGYIYKKRTKIIHYKNIKYYQYRDKPKRCQHCDYANIYEFISSIKNKSAILKDSHDIKKYIDKFVLASILTAESRFMLYFSIFEGVRNRMNKERKIGIKENFKFLRDPKKELYIDLRKHKSKVSKTDRKLFEESILGKITNIKRYPVKKQFESFLNSRFVKLDLSNYDLELNGILKLRHKIFHGDFIKDDATLKSINLNLERFASKMIRITMNAKDNYDKEISSS